VYFLITALMLGGAAFTQANLLFWSFGLMIGGIVCSFFLTFVLMRRIEIKRLLPSHGVVDEAMAIRYRIKNRKRWLPAINLIINEQWVEANEAPAKQDAAASDSILSNRTATLGGSPHAWVMHLGPRQTLQAEAPCWPRSRGVLTLDSVVVASSFPFGLFRWSMRIRQRDQLIVYPALFRMKKSLTGTLTLVEPTGSLRHQRPGGAEEFYGLRPYRVGDSQRMIDWKRTARTGQLISRQMTQGSPPRIMLLLDLTVSAEQAPRERQGEHDSGSVKGSGAKLRDEQDAWKENQIERAISLAASVICDAYQNGYSIGMVVAGASCEIFPIHHSLPHRSRMLNALALLDPSGAATLSEVLPAEPNVFIHAGAAPQGPVVHSGRPHLYGSQINQYMESGGDSHSLLSRHSQSAPVGRGRSARRMLVTSQT